MNIRKQARGTAITGAFALAVFASSCSLASSIGPSRHAQRTGRDIVTLVSHTQIGSTLGLTAAVRGNWTRVYIMGPYQLPESIDHVLGFSWSLAGDLGTQSDAGDDLLVFVSGNRVIDYALVPVKDADFTPYGAQAGYGKGFPRGESYVVVKPSLPNFIYKRVVPTTLVSMANGPS